MHFYITGDTHGDFSRIAEFCEANGTDADDVMIILGDAGINYYLDVRDRNLKNELTRLPITLFCILGTNVKDSGSSIAYPVIYIGSKIIDQNAVLTCAIIFLFFSIYDIHLKRR